MHCSIRYVKDQGFKHYGRGDIPVPLKEKAQCDKVRVRNHWSTSNAEHDGQFLADRRATAISPLILHRLVSEMVGFTFHLPTRDGVAQTATQTAHRAHIFSEVEQVHADAADLAQACERMSLRLRVTVSYSKRESEDGRIVLRRATRIADFDDAVHGPKTIRLDAAHQGVVVLLHQIAFGDVIRAAFGTEDEEAVEAGPVIDFS